MSIIVKSSLVKLSVQTLEGRCQFGIKARVPIPRGTFLHCLIGLMASDSKYADQVELSVITPHHDNLGPPENRILVGPLRFINHSCLPNIEVSTTGLILYRLKVTCFTQWCAVKNTDAYVPWAKKAIVKDEELFANYGEGWWNEKESCPCNACMQRPTPRRSTRRTEA